MTIFLLLIISIWFFLSGYFIGSHLTKTKKPKCMCEQIEKNLEKIQMLAETHLLKSREFRRKT